MPVFPRLPQVASKREVIDSFRGYDHRMKIKKNEFYDMVNLSSASYPMLSCRESRGEMLRLEQPGGMLAKEKLAYIEKGRLWYGGEETPVTVSAGEKQLVSMGAYICIFPDKLFYNTADPTDYGSMEARYSSAGAVKGSLCRMDGTEYQTPRVADAAGPPGGRRAHGLDSWRTFACNLPFPLERPSRAPPDRDLLRLRRLGLLRRLRPGVPGRRPGRRRPEGKHQRRGLTAGSGRFLGDERGVQVDFARDVVRRANRSRRVTLIPSKAQVDMLFDDKKGE